MSFVAPQPATIDLYNHLVSLPYSDREEIGKLEFRLRQIRRQKPADPRIAVATLQALMMGGKAAEARELADWIWDRRQSLESDVEFTFASQLMDLARSDRASAILDPMLDGMSDNGYDEAVVSIIRYAAFFNGDLALLAKLAAILSDLDNARGHHEARLLGAVMARLRDVGLDKHFREHQEIVRSVVGNLQCAAHVVPFTQEGELDLCIYSFVAADRTSRRVLESRMDDALAHYYIRQGLSAAAYVPFITTSVLDLAACPAPRGRS